MNFTPLYPARDNGDAALQIHNPMAPQDPPIVGLGSFHKTLRHNGFGEVDADQFAGLRSTVGSAQGDFSSVGAAQDQGPLTSGRLVNPMAGLAHESHGPDPQDMSMPPAPAVASASTAAELVELYHMALLRDLALDQWEGNTLVASAVADTAQAFGRALGQPAPAPGAPDDGRLRLRQDLPVTPGGQLDQRAQTLFRCGLPGEDLGPLVSQFFLHDVAYGTQLIQQKQFAYAHGQDYLQTKADWLHAQNLGRSVGTENDIDAFEYGRANERDAAFEGGSQRTLRRMRSLRDLARFVHKDALHQAYFNAALLLLGWGAARDPGNPYENGAFGRRQAGFGTLGGPHLLTLVSEVASRALKVVWRQKWGVHLRLRPEAYAGALEMERRHGRPYGLLAHFSGHFDTLLQDIGKRNGTDPDDTGKGPQSLFLPMAFESGSPAHPAYGAGHATVAGACVTILKAWFDEKQALVDVLAKHPARHPVSQALVALVQPGEPDKVGELPALMPTVAAQLTVGGELNKLASNVAMGRSMGGVHWRSDNTRSLRLGEQIATIMLRRQCRDYAEPGLCFSYCSFDGHPVKVHSNGRVTVAGDAALEQFYNQAAFAPRS